MDIVEKLMGWKEISSDKVNKGIIRIADKKFANSKIKTIYINGNTFRYKVTDSTQLADFNGHSVGISNGERKYYRKLR